MERKRRLLMAFLLFTIQMSYCDESFDLDVGNGQKKFDKSGAVDPHSEKTLTDDKNLNKRDSLYNENGKGNPNFDYQNNFSDFGAKNNVYVEKETEKKYDVHQGSEWDERNRASSSYGGGIGGIGGMGGMDGPRDFMGGNQQNNNNNNNNNNIRNDWDKSKDFFESGSQSQMNDERQSQYQGNAFSGNMDMNANFPNNQRGFPNNKNNYLNSNNIYPNNNFYQNQRDFEHHREQDFNAEKQKTTRIRARYEIPSPNYFSNGHNFNAMENLNFQKPEKAIIINLRTECPLLSPARSQVMHKFLLPPKLRYNPHHPSSSQLYMNNHLLSSNAASPNIYYI